MEKLTVWAVLNEHGDRSSTLTQHAGCQLVGGTAHVDAAHFQELVTDLQSHTRGKTVFVNGRHENAPSYILRAVDLDSEVKRLHRFIN